MDPGEPAAAVGGSQGATGPITWASWANPGEGERFKAFSQNYTKQYGNKVTWQQVVGDYQSKLLTQLAGGSAPDAFYVGDGKMAKFIETGQLEDLTSFLDSSEAPVKASDTYPGLIKWCRPVNGQGLFGIPVDCNPKVFWFNKDMLSAAGVTTNPAALFEGGSWNQAALDDLLNKVKGTGKRGMVVQANWFDFTSIVTTFGGTAFDEKSGDCVWDKDEKAMAALTWLFDHFKNETITYGGSLPKGQGVDALFYGKQLATMPVGPLDPAEPEETEVRLRHRPDAVRGRQDGHAGGRLLRGHVGQYQGQGQAGRADVPRALRQQGRPEVPAVWRR